MESAVNQPTESKPQPRAPATQRGTPGGFGRRCWFGLLLVGITVAVYHRAPGHEFLTWDDDIHITRNRFLDPVTVPNVLRFWKEPYENLYIPLSYTFFACEAYLSRFFVSAEAAVPLHPAVFHTGSLLLHLGCVLLVFGILNALVRHDGAAWFGALLFGLHPLQVESVAWVGETRGLLSGLFSLVAVWQYLLAAGLNRCQGIWAPAAAAPRAGAWRHYLLATLAFGLALLSKPSAVSVPLIVALLDLGLLRRSWRQTVRSLALWLIMAAAISWLTKVNQSDARLAFVAPLWARPLVAADALAFYLVKLVAPFHLGFDYGRAPKVVMQQAWFYWAWLLPCGLVIVLALVSLRRVWLVSFGVFVAGLLPVLGLVPFLYQDISTVADRYLYLPMLGVSLGLAAWLARHGDTPRLVLWSLVLGLLGGIGYSQVKLWHDDLVMYGQGLRVNPGSYVAHYNLGGRFRLQGNHDQAQAHYLWALAINPQYARAHVDLGVSLMHQERVDEAIEHYLAALEIDPDFAGAHVNLGNAFFKQGKQQQALAELQTALALDPRSAEGNASLGKALVEMGKAEEGIAHFQAALQASPEFAEVHLGLAIALTRQQRTVEALEHLQAALRYRADYAEAHNALGAILLGQNKLAAAARHFGTALEINPHYFEARFNLGLALVGMGRADEALEQFRHARRLAPKGSPEEKQIDDILRSFEPPP